MKFLLLINCLFFSSCVFSGDIDVVNQYLRELQEQGVISEHDVIDINKQGSSLLYKGADVNSVSRTVNGARSIGVQGILKMLIDNNLIDANDASMLSKSTMVAFGGSEGSQVKSFYADAFLVFVEAGLLLVNEWKVLSAKILPVLNSAKALVQSIKMTSDEIVSANKIKRTRESKIDFMKEKLNINFQGKVFKVGGVSASGCFKKKQDDANSDIFNNIYPIMDDVNDELSFTIERGSAETHGYDDLQRMNMFLENRVNPFLGSIPVESKQELSFAIKQFVNPKLYNISRGKALGSSDADRGSRYLRYEIMVKVLQGVVSNLSSYIVNDSNGLSKELIDRRMYAKSVSNNVNLSLTIKNIDGNYKELNETLSNQLKLQMDNIELQELKLRLLSVLSSSSVDIFEGQL